jgi:hypothetical protein
VVRGWYAGGVPSQAANAADNSLLLMSYSQIKAGVERSFSKAPLRESELAQGHETFLTGALAGALGSFVTSIALCPIEMIKVRCHTGEQSSMARCAVNIMRQGGPRALFKGFGATIFQGARGRLEAAPGLPASPGTSGALEPGGKRQARSGARLASVAAELVRRGDVPGAATPCALSLCTAERSCPTPSGARRWAGAGAAPPPAGACPDAAWCASG